MADLSETIEQNASGPAEATGDSGSMKQHSLQDQIAADRYLAAKHAANQPRRGLRLTRLVGPGTA